MDVTPYLGLEWAPMGRGPAYDCWGLVRLVLAREFGRDVPSYQYGDDHTDAVAAGIDLFYQVDDPRPGDVVLFTRPLHVGLLVQPSQMLHITHDKDSRVERIGAIRTRRATGYYRLRDSSPETSV